MGLRGLLLRGIAVLALAAAAGHVAQIVRPGPDLGNEPIRQADRTPPAAPTPVGVPATASLGGGLAPEMAGLVGITSVAAELPATDPCPATLSLAPAPDAMIDLHLQAPCNASQRIVVRHAGLAFTAQTDQSGTARLFVPAFQPVAVVAVYLQGSGIALGQVQVPEVTQLRRLAFQWATPERFSLRVTEGARVYVASPHDPAGPKPVILALGSAAVPGPMQAQVYTFPTGPGAIDLAVELRVGPETCGRTLSAQTVLAEWGRVTLHDLPVAVPLCGTAGDILVLKNLAPDLTLAAPR